MRKIVLIVTILFTSSVFQKALSWFDQGHMIVAAIAYDELTDEEKREVDRLTLILKDVEPKIDNFIEASTWMDGIKGVGFTYFNNLHYVNKYHMVYQPKYFPKQDPNNVVETVKKSKKILQSKWSKDQAKAWALRFLSHTVGDIHQPMHNCSQVTEENPKGDLGGNKFIIKKIEFGKYNGKTSYLNNLHKLWDSGVMGFAKHETNDYSVNKELVEKDKKAIAEFIKSLPTEEQKEIENRINTVFNPEEWSQHSYMIAVNYAYKNLKPYDAVSKSYIENGQKQCKIQAYIAGKRLAKLLHEIFSK